VLDYDAVFVPGGLGPIFDITGNPEVLGARHRPLMQMPHRRLSSPCAPAARRCHATGGGFGKSGSRLLVPAAAGAVTVRL
jgi:hypothetical protein